MSLDTDLVAGYMKDLNEKGLYQVSDSLKAAIKAEFWAGCCDDQGAQDAIARVFAQYGYLCDTHTATAWAVAEDYVNQTGDTTPMVVLSTASPYKFPAAVLSSLEALTTDDEFAMMTRLQEKTGVPIPKNLCGLQEKKELHTHVIPKEQMLSYVTKI